MSGGEFSCSAHWLTGRAAFSVTNYVIIISMSSSGSS